ncbi:MAG: hypothetical protein NUV60_03705 [Patescibacteria group bacterium]|nr:hypothetical protein [Patescibacteria group bacterium]
MHNVRLHLPFSPLALCYGAAGILLVVYIGLISVVMGYATLTVEFSQSVKDDGAAIALLEGEYLASVARITGTDYVVEGYAKPLSILFVRSESSTALR